MSECKERQFWHKQFIFASWLFLFLGVLALFSGNLWVAAFATTLSFAYRAVDTILDIRHLRWHISNDKGGHYM